MNQILKEDVLFVDESMFELNRNKTKVFQFHKAAMPEVEKLSTWVRQMVFAGISLRGKTQIYFVNGWINNQKYTDLLKSARRDILNLFPGEFHFVQDNAKPHKHLNSMRYINRWITPNIKDYPPQSLISIR